MNRLIKYLDRHLVRTSKWQLWLMFILYLFNGGMDTLKLRKETLENGTMHDSWFWLGAAAAPIWLLCASLNACLLIRSYRRHSNPLPPSQP